MVFFFFFTDYLLSMSFLPLLQDLGADVCIMENMVPFSTTLIDKLQHGAELFRI
jgi:hypothetical protein